MYSHFMCISKPSGLLQIVKFSVRKMCNGSHSDKRSHLLRKNARAIFDAAVKSVLPHSMVKNVLQVDGRHLYINGNRYMLDHNVHILAFGKAVIGMVRAAEDKLGEQVCAGLASVPHGIVQQFQQLEKWALLPKPQSKVKLIEGARNNLPDAASHSAATQIYSYAKSLTEKDIALVLISGGGSALLSSPIPPITIEDLIHVTRLLASHGATIDEMNTVRKQIEILKGGGLAQVAAPAKVISLVLSDVIGDPLSSIASGPTYPDHTTSQMCLDLFSRFGIREKVPKTVVQVLEKGTKELLSRGTYMSGQGTDNTDFTNVSNLIIGSNKIACNSAKSFAEQLDCVPYIISTSLSGDAGTCGQMFAEIALYIYSIVNQSVESVYLQKRINEAFKGSDLDETVLTDLKNLVHNSLNSGKPMCIIGAGETTVNVKGNGKGGRNQEMALYWARSMDNILQKTPSFREGLNVAFLSCGTDGQDGPCESAGAVVSPGIIREGVKQGLDPNLYLDNNDSFHYFSRLRNGKFHVVTGLTGTNVMDIQLLMIEPQ